MAWKYFGLIWVTVLTFTLLNWVKPRKIAVRAAASWAENWTREFRNMKQGCRPSFGADLRDGTVSRQMRLLRRVQYSYKELLQERRLRIFMVLVYRKTAWRISSVLELVWEMLRSTIITVSVNWPTANPFGNCNFHWQESCVYTELHRRSYAEGHSVSAVICLTRMRWGFCILPNRLHSLADQVLSRLLWKLNFSTEFAICCHWTLTWAKIIGFPPSFTFRLTF